MSGFDTENGADGVVATEAAPPPPDPAPVPPSDPMDPRRFGAMHAILTFVLLLFAQLAMGFITIFVAVIWTMANGGDVAREMPGMLDRLMIPTIIASSIGSVVVTLALTRFWAWHLVRDKSPAGLGLFVPRRRELWLCIFAGAVLGAGFIALTLYVPTSFRGGPLAKVAASSGAGRAIWAILAVLVAPPIEELLFRGLMLRGLMASWGVRTAGIIVTVLFFTLHLFEASGYWPAMLAIFALSIATLVARLRTGSVIAAMALHAAYNIALVVAVYATRLSR